MKVKELPTGLQNLLVAHEAMFFNSDMGGEEKDFEEQCEWILASDIQDLNWLYDLYTEQIEGE